VIQLMT
jgi:hypothetical protein